MRYRATVQLFFKGRPIKPGELIPKGYPERDLNKVVARGWAEPDRPGVPVAPPPSKGQHFAVTASGPGSDYAPGPKPEDTNMETVGESVIQDAVDDVVSKNKETVVENLDPATKTKPDSIADLDDIDSDVATAAAGGDNIDQSSLLVGNFEWLKSQAQTSLVQKGIVTVSDLEDWSEKELIKLPGIGTSSARRLLRHYRDEVEARTEEQDGDEATTAGTDED